MPRKNRGYKRGEPYRDARLFVIVCEGNKREKEYFTELAEGHRRVKVRLLPPTDDDSGKSAPKHVVERATNYVKEYGLAKDDQLWLVMDVDRWGEEVLIPIGKECQKKNSWNVALSNPCFEVWLHLHLQDVSQTPTKTCQQMKGELHELITSGYKVEVFTPLVDQAVERASIADNNQEHFYPAVMTTKVYLLINEMKRFFQS